MSCGKISDIKRWEELSMSNNLKSDEPKVRVNISFPESLIVQLREIAKKENRSLNMQVITMLQKSIENGK